MSLLMDLIGMDLNGEEMEVEMEMEMEMESTAMERNRVEPAIYVASSFK